MSARRTLTAVLLAALALAGCTPREQVATAATGTVCVILLADADDQNIDGSEYAAFTAGTTAVDFDGRRWTATRDGRRVVLGYALAEDSAAWNSAACAATERR